jgi:hypothetical protein
MASEAEIERLYQLFVAKGGGAGTFDNTNLTPKQYSDATASSQLTALQLAQLQAREHQYNKSVALNSIADEIAANNFSNPYAARGAYSSSLFGSSGLATGATNVGLLSSALSSFSTGEKALIFAGVLAGSGVDLEQILKIAGLSAVGLAMFSSLTDHTNNQTANIPQTMADASSLASMNSQFGPAGGPLPPGETDCTDFNDLMGILGGVFDGTLDFIDSTIQAIISLINQTGVTSLLTSIISAVQGAGSIVGDVIGAIIQALVGAGVALMKTLSPLVGKIFNAITDMTSQIAKELAGVIDMAAELLRKALALVLGSAALDPCQSAVLTNTGSLAMKDAVALLKHPMGTGAPGGIGTTVDDRANSEEVLRAMTNAEAKALIDDGVPQSPFTETAKSYTAHDSSLHNNTTTSDYWTRKILSTQYTNLSKEWMPSQKDYIVNASKLISQMEKAQESKEASQYSSRINQLISGLLDQVENVKSLRTNYRQEFTYVTNNINIYDKIDNANEIKIASRYQSIIKPAMTRTYNTAVTTLNNTKTSWNSIAEKLYY